MYGIKDKPTSPRPERPKPMGEIHDGAGMTVKAGNDEIKSRFVLEPFEKVLCKDCVYGVVGQWSSYSISCHRKAPMAIDNAFKCDKWPRMDQSDWCGEGRKK